MIKVTFIKIYKPMRLEIRQYKSFMCLHDLVILLYVLYTYKSEMAVCS